MTRPLRTSIASRSAKLLSTAARVGASEVGRRLSSSSGTRQRLEQAALIAQTLGELKGAVMKVGQLLSIDGADVLPPEVLRVLETLQSNAEPVDFDVMRGVIDEDLGRAAEALEDLQAIAHASASIGQVHLARVDGRPVAVKAQYPGIRDTIDSDLAALRRLVGALTKAAGRSFDLDELFDELGHGLHLEADYEHERASLEGYRQMLADDPRYVVPETYPELSGPRVLTMSFEAGTPILEHARARQSDALNHRLSRLLLDLYCIEFFDHGVVQTDPNPANFLVNASDQLVLLDFGATLSYSEEFRQTYVELLGVLGSGDRARIIEAGLDLGYVDARESEEVRELFAEFLLLAVEPFRPERQPFQFDSPDYAERSRIIGRDFVTGLRYSAPPRDLIFLHRKLGGLFNIIKQMGVSIDLTEYWDRFVGRSPVS